MWALQMHPWYLLCYETPLNAERKTLRSLRFHSLLAVAHITGHKGVKVASRQAGATCPNLTPACFTLGELHAPCLCGVGVQERCPWSEPQLPPPPQRTYRLPCIHHGLQIAEVVHLDVPHISRFVD